MTLGAPPADLCVPEPGSATGARVLSASMRRVLLELFALAPGPSASEHRRREVAAMGRAIGAARAREPGAVAALARAPTVSVFVRCLRANASAGQRDAWLGELVGNVAFELALAGLLDQPVELSAPPAQLLSPARRRRAAIAAERIVIRPDGRVEGAEIDERVYYAVSGDIVLALCDNNPLAMTEAHPDKDGNRVDLGTQEPAVWARALADALDLVAAHLPGVRADIDVFVRQIVPVGTFAERHLSASYQEAVGTVYASLHPSVLTMAEALIHEAAHNKLNALFDLDDLLEDGQQPLFASPVRPDPRPLAGVLLAVHAFLPVARLYERMLERGAGADVAARFERVKEVNREGAAVLLAHARPTPFGRALLDEIERWRDHFG